LRFVNKRKILVFAHVPPPHHGQSVMVQILLEGLWADLRFEVHHVDARVSDDMEDVGSFRPGKLLRLLKCVAQAWWIRLRHGRMAFYYVPAPAKRSAIMRDWVVMALCRPLFPELILHWHAYGLGEWAASGNDWQLRLTRWALGKADLAIVLNNYNKRDAEVFAPKRIEVVPNGIADLFPDYDERLAPKRNARAIRLRQLGLRRDKEGLAAVTGSESRVAGEEKRDSPAVPAQELTEDDGALREGQHSNILKNVRMSGEGGGLEVGGGCGEASSELHGVKDRGLKVVEFLFLGHLIESKGVFVAIEATRMANEELRKANAPWRAHLTLAGSFASEDEKARVLAAIETANEAAGDEGPCVTLVGFLDSGQKKSALEKADALVFPTFYENEAQPLVLFEAMCAGLPVVTTSWRGIAEPLPADYPLIVEPRSASSLARVLADLRSLANSECLRTKYECEYKMQLFAPRIADIFLSQAS